VGSVTLLLIAALLCAESPNGSLEDRTLIAHTIGYRSQVTGLSLLTIITQPSQYQGLGLIDWQGYRLYRKREMGTNFMIAYKVLFCEEPLEVSNFCEVGKTCIWERDCLLKTVTNHHKFYLCEDWVSKGKVAK